MESLLTQYLISKSMLPTDMGRLCFCLTAALLQRRFLEIDSDEVEDASRGRTHTHQDAKFMIMHIITHKLASPPFVQYCWSINPDRSYQHSHVERRLDDFLASFSSNYSIAIPLRLTLKDATHVHGRASVSQPLASLILR
jgi:hypothetical protein